MAVITIGPGATVLNTSSTGTLTYLEKTNPANGSGLLTSMSFYCEINISGMKCGTYYGSGTSWTLRDYENIGNITSGSKQTFTGLSCDVQLNDLIGHKKSSGQLYLNNVGGYGGILLYSGDGFSGGTNTYTSVDGYNFAVEGTGETATAIEWNGVNISELNGVAIASINTP